MNIFIWLKNLVTTRKERQESLTSELMKAPMYTELDILIEEQDNPTISHKYDMMEMTNLHEDELKRYSTFDEISLEVLYEQNLNLK